MPTFRINETRITDEPTITVETTQNIVGPIPSPLVTLSPGRHRFQLVVEDDKGNKSDPAFVDVTVTPPTTTGPGRVLDRSGPGVIGGLGGIIRPPR